MASQPIQFEDIRDELQRALNTKLQKGNFPGESELKLIDGFITMPIDQIYDSSTRLGGRHIPSVAVVGSSTGRLYLFAVKALLPKFGEQLSGQE